MSEFTRSERLFLWLADKSPRWLLEQPERVFLNVACLVIGLTTMLPPPPNNVLAAFPDAGRVVLGAVMALGALVSLWGSATLSRVADRVGALALGGAAAFFAVILFGAVGLRAQITGVIFLGIFTAKGFRFVRATALRIRIRHHLLEEKARQEGQS